MNFLFAFFCVYLTFLVQKKHFSVLGEFLFLLDFFLAEWYNLGKSICEKIAMNLRIDFSLQNF